MSERDLLVGQLLVNAGLINVRQLEEALSRQKASGGLLCSILVKSGAADKNKVFNLLSSQLSIPFVNLKITTPDPEAIKRVPAKIACHYKIAPLNFSGQILSLAMSDPLDIKTLDDLELFLDLKVKGVLAYEEDVLDAIRRIYGIGAATIEKMMDKQPATATKVQANAEEMEAVVDDASVTKFVDQIMREAVKDRASDIHLEPFENGVRTRFRIDGVLYDVNTPESVKYFYPAIVSRIKIMSNLNIAEKRLPQDGRIKLSVNNDELDLRVSILPSVYGEAVQVRVLSTRFFLELEKLGLLDVDLKLLEQIITKPHGVIFLTGPTGSGKSTTLYACLARLNSPTTKIITIEDPVEYQLSGIIQMQVQPKIGFDFAAGLRHTLRHDPDVIMVGEARDFATAEIAIRSALTGHLVFSTLHTNDAGGTVTRLLDMGVEPFLVSSSCECFIAQRLVRLICANCGQPAKLDSKALSFLNEEEQRIVKDGLSEGKGCPTCRNTGYHGRTAIYEILPVRENIRKLILARASSQTIKQQAIKDGMRTLRQDGLRKAAAGLTTLSEVIRVTSGDENAEVLL